MILVRTYVYGATEVEELRETLEWSHTLVLKEVNELVMLGISFIIAYQQSDRGRDVGGKSHSSRDE